MVDLDVVVGSSTRRVQLVYITQRERLEPQIVRDGAVVYQNCGDMMCGQWLTDLADHGHFRRHFHPVG